MYLRSAIKTMETTSNEAFYIIDLKHKDIVYMSRNLSDSLQEFYKKSSLTVEEQCVRSIMPEDAQIYRSALALLPSIYNKLSKSERSTLMLSGHYCLSSGNCKVLVFERAMPLFVDAEGNIRLIWVYRNRCVNQTNGTNAYHKIKNRPK